MPDTTWVNPLPRVGYFYSYFPPEILYALGRVPVQILPTAHNTSAVEPYLHKNFCALSKLILAGFLDSATPSATLDLEGVVFTDHCDTQRRLYDVWRAYAPVPALAFLDLPRRTDSLGVDFYAAALDRFAKQCEDRFGRTLTAAALASSIRLYNHQRALWSDLCAAWVAGRISTRQYYALRDLRWTTDPDTANMEIEAALAGAEQASSLSGRAPRIMVMGSLQIHRGLIDAIEEDGRARVVAEESACDERAVMTSIPTEGSREHLLHALALAYLNRPAPRLRDLPRRLDYLARLVETRQVDGVVCSYYKFCDPFLAEFPIVKRFFHGLDIPVLLLEDEGEAAFRGQARTRLDAFLEVNGG